MDEKKIDELRNGLKKVTERLNKKRGLWSRCIAGQKFLFHTEGIPSITEFFQIRTKYRNGRKGVCADIKIDGENLKGDIVPAKKYAKPICSYLHAFSHKHDISLRNLAHVFSEYL